MKTTTRLAVLAGLLAFYFYAIAPMLFGVSQARESSGQPMAAAQRKPLIQLLLSRLDGYYLLPEKAAEMRRVVEAAEAAGKYEHLTAGAQLANALTNDLRSVQADHHLNVEYKSIALGPEEPPQGSKPDPAPDPGLLASSLRSVAALVRNYGVTDASVLDGNVGYLRLSVFSPVYQAAPKFASAMRKLHDTRALIVDLRNNGGGSTESVLVLASYFFDQRTRLNDTVFPREGVTVEGWTLDQLEGPRYGQQKPVYILTSRGTFSAAEDFAYAMQQQKRAVVVGESTRGGAHLVELFHLSDHFRVWVPTAYSLNALSKGNWEKTGVKPDLPMDANNALLRTQERLARH